MTEKALLRFSYECKWTPPLQVAPNVWQWTSLRPIVHFNELSNNWGTFSAVGFSMVQMEKEGLQLLVSSSEMSLHMICNCLLCHASRQITVIMLAISQKLKRVQICLSERILFWRERCIIGLFLWLRLLWAVNFEIDIEAEERICLLLITHFLVKSREGYTCLLKNRSTYAINSVNCWKPQIILVKRHKIDREVNDPFLCSLVFPAAPVLIQLSNYRTLLDGSLIADFRNIKTIYCLFETFAAFRGVSCLIMFQLQISSCPPVCPWSWSWAVLELGKGWTLLVWTLRVDQHVSRQLPQLLSTHCTVSVWHINVPVLVGSNSCFMLQTPHFSRFAGEFMTWMCAFGFYSTPFMVDTFRSYFLLRKYNGWVTSCSAPFRCIQPLHK